MKLTRSIKALGAGLAMLALTAAGCGNTDEAIEVELSPAATNGQLRAKESGCQACHSVTGDDGSAPTWAGLYGSTITLSDDSEITVDDDYIITSVREPNAQRRKGVGGAMGAYDEKRISDEDLADIVEFIKALGDA